jgi:beta-barrel assembly-enhancing protease
VKFRSLITAAVLACFIPSTFAQSLPELGDASSATLSEQQERTIGNAIMREVRADKDYIDDPEISDYINRIGQRLLQAADPPVPPIDFFVMRDDTINAFALTGGHIGVHSALILLTQNESELAGVLGHEITHILQKHQARMLHGQRGATFASLAALAVALLASRSSASQGSQITEAAVASAGALSIQSQINYTREHEREADRGGLQLMQRAGYDPRGMETFFDRMMRANRLNEYKGAPAYLRTHPLTTERIADMEDRIQHMPLVLGMRPSTTEYLLVKAKLRVASMAPTEAVDYYRRELESQTVLRPREDVYGLALALRRTRDFAEALKVLEPLRVSPSDPAFELLAGELLADMGKTDEALGAYRAALRNTPSYRALSYAYFELLLERGHAKRALAELEDTLRILPQDARLYEIQARAFEATGQPLAQHRAQAEAYYRRGNLSRAVEQLEIAVKAKGSDFYQASSAESRLRELRAQLEIEKAAEKALKIS